MAELSNNQRRFLSRYACRWCDQTLDKDWCSAIFEKCSEEIRDKRRKDCLKAYKPRHRDHPTGAKQRAKSYGGRVLRKAHD